MARLTLTRLAHARSSPPFIPAVSLEPTKEAFMYGLKPMRKSRPSVH
jgi:hypothetical protein